MSDVCGRDAGEFAKPLQQLGGPVVWVLGKRTWLLWAEIRRNPAWTTGMWPVLFDLGDVVITKLFLRFIDGLVSVVSVAGPKMRTGCEDG